jgi:Fe2+ or Zn2+ uptake regulation protein
MNENEISFITKWYGEDDDAIPITQLSTRVPYEVWRALVKAGAIRKIHFDNYTVYDVNEEKAIPILQKYGYKVVSKSEEKKVERDYEPVATFVSLHEKLGEVKDQ